MAELPDLVIGIEIDENSHGNREIACELAKLDDHRWGAGSNPKPAVCIRMNPDPRPGMGGDDEVTLERRCELVRERLMHYARCPLGELHELGTVVVYVCYGRNGEKHIVAAREKEHFRVEVVVPEDEDDDTGESGDGS